MPLCTSCGYVGMGVGIRVRPKSPLNRNSAYRMIQIAFLEYFGRGRGRICEEVVREYAREEEKAQKEDEKQGKALSGDETGQISCQNDQKGFGKGSQGVQIQLPDSEKRQIYVIYRGSRGISMGFRGIPHLSSPSNIAKIQ